MKSTHFYVSKVMFKKWGKKWGLRCDTKKLPFEDFIVTTEQATLGLKKPKANRLRNDVVGILKHARPRQPNINAEERKTLKVLASNKKITVQPADKRKVNVVI